MEELLIVCWWNGGWFFIVNVFWCGFMVVGWGWEDGVVGRKLFGVWISV